MDPALQEARARMALSSTPNPPDTGTIGPQPPFSLMDIVRGLFGSGQTAPAPSVPLQQAIPPDAQLRPTSEMDKLRNLPAALWEGLRERGLGGLLTEDLAKKYQEDIQAGLPQGMKGPQIQAPSLLQRLTSNYEPARRAQSVFDTLQPFAEAVFDPANVTPGGAALHAASPIGLASRAAKVAEEAAEGVKAATKAARAARTAEEVKAASATLMTKQQALAAARQEVEKLNAMRGPGTEAGLDPNAPFAQYATEYPPVPPPVIAKDPTTGKKYIGRGTSPETRDALDTLGTVKQQIADQGVRTSKNPDGWKPMFDPEQRAYADPTPYPDPEPIEASMPTNEATRARYRQKIQTPENIDRARQYVKQGINLIDPKTGLHAGDLWYAIGQLQQKLIDVMGRVPGLERFKQITQGMASTTSGATPETNLRSTMYGLFLNNHERPLPTGPNIEGKIKGSSSYAMPVPTSGARLGQNMDFFDKVINKGKELLMSGEPKRTSFDGNLSGRLDMSTIDQQVVQAITPEYQPGDTFRRGQWGYVDKKTGKFTPGEIKEINAPEGDSYFAYDEIMDQLAKEFKMDKPNVQAMLWVGKKYAEEGEISVPFIQEINNMIERTARVTGRTPEEVFQKGFAYKDKKSAIPLYGFLGALGAGTAAAAAGGGQKPKPNMQ